MAETSGHRPPGRTMNRRTLGKLVVSEIAAVVGAATTVAGGKYFTSAVSPLHSDQLANKASADAVGAMTGTLPETANDEPAPPLFADTGAEKIAKELNITPGSFFNSEDTLPVTFEGYKSRDLLPVFHPHVIAHKNLIYQLSEDYNIAPNVIATLMAISSGGDPRAEPHPERSTTGLFQFNRRLHQQVILDASHDEVEYKSKTEDDFAMIAFNKCLESAKVHKEEDGRKRHLRDPDVALRAFAMYQSGIESAKDDFANLPEDARWITQNANRLFQILEIAQKMRDDGEKDTQIVSKLLSEEVNTRAYAYTVAQGVFRSNDEALQYLSSPALEPLVDNNGLLIDNNTLDADISEETSAKLDAYSAYMRYKKMRDYDKFQYPLNPAIRVLTVTSKSTGFIENDDVNKDPKNWLNLDTEDNPLTNPLHD